MTASDGQPFADIGVLLDTSSSRLSEPLLSLDLLDLLDLERLTQRRYSTTMLPILDLVTGD